MNSFYQSAFVILWSMVTGVSSSYAARIWVQHRDPVRTRVRDTIFLNKSKACVQRSGATIDTGRGCECLKMRGDPKLAKM